jgi:hypothetical protein
VSAESDLSAVRKLTVAMTGTIADKIEDVAIGGDQLRTSLAPVAAVG